MIWDRFYPRLEAHHVVHCNVHPHNILCTPSLQFLLTDAAMGPFTVARPSVHVWAYRSPIVSTRPYWKSQDVYALGVCIWEASCGTLPFSSGTFTGFVRQWAAGLPEPPGPALRRVFLRRLCGAGPPTAEAARADPWLLTPEDAEALDDAPARQEAAVLLPPLLPSRMRYLIRLCAPNLDECIRRHACDSALPFHSCRLHQLQY